MPTGRKGKGQSKAPVADIPGPEEEEKELSEAEEIVEESTPPARGKKRAYNSVSAGEEDLGGEMHSLLTSFKTDISKSLGAKRKRLETFAQQSMKSSNKRVEEVWKTQQKERERLGDAYEKQVSAVLQQWETDISKSKESEEKLQDMFKQQQKLFQQQRIVQTQRLKTIKQLHEQYTKGMEELHRCHHDQQVTMQVELKKEMTQLQKKFLMEMQTQGISNVRRSLQTMLTQV